MQIDSCFFDVSKATFVSHHRRKRVGRSLPKPKLRGGEPVEYKPWEQEL